MPKKNIATIEGLAGMIARGFNGVESRIAAVENKMATKDQLEKVERRLTERIDNIEKLILRQ